MSDLVIKHAGTTQTQGYQGPISAGAALGQNGAIFVSAFTNAVTPADGSVFVAVTFVEDTVFDSGTAGLIGEDDTKWPSTVGTGTAIDADGGAVVDSVTFPAGLTIFGRWTSLKIDSGKIIAYVG